MGKSCGTGRRGKSQFKKGSDWCKFSIWNRVMGSQPIRIQLGKFLQENLAENSHGKILRENLVGNSCGKILINGKILWKNLAGKSCGKILWENLAGNSCRKTLWDRVEGKSQFKKCSDSWKFRIWNRVMGSQPIRIQIRKSCGKILWKNLAGKSCGKILWENLEGKSEGNFSSWMLNGYLPITPYVNLCKLSLSIKGRNIFENNQLCFGNWWGKFIKVFIEWTLILFTPVGFTSSVIKNCKSNLYN